MKKQELVEFRTSTDPVYTVDLSGDGLAVAVGQQADSQTGLALGIWSIRDRRLTDTIIEDPDTITEAARFSPDGRLLAYIDSRQNIQVRNLDTGAVTEFLSPFTRWLDYARDSNRVLAAGQTTRVWDATLKRVLWSLPAPPLPREAGRGHIGALNPEGTRVAVLGAEGGHVLVYEIEGGRLVTRLSGAMDAARSIAFNGRLVGAIGADSHGMCLWDFESGERILPDLFNLGTEAYWTLRFHPDGKYVALGTWSGFLSVVRIADGEFVIDEVVHEGRVQDISFSRDGARLATCGDDGFVRIWSLSE